MTKLTAAYVGLFLQGVAFGLFIYGLASGMTLERLALVMVPCWVGAGFSTWSLWRE